MNITPSRRQGIIIRLRILWLNLAVYLFIQFIGIALIYSIPSMVMAVASMVTIGLFTHEIRKPPLYKPHLLWHMAVSMMLFNLISAIILLVYQSNTYDYSIEVIFYLFYLIDMGISAGLAIRYHTYASSLIDPTQPAMDPPSMTLEKQEEEHETPRIDPTIRFNAKAFEEHADEVNI